MREALRIRERYPARHAMFVVALVAMMAGLLAAMRPSPQELKAGMCPAERRVRPLMLLSTMAPDGAGLKGLWDFASSKPNSAFESR